MLPLLPFVDIPEPPISYQVVIQDSNYDEKGVDAIVISSEDIHSFELFENTANFNHVKEHVGKESTYPLNISVCDFEYTKGQNILNERYGELIEKINLEFIEYGNTIFEEPKDFLILSKSIAIKISEINFQKSAVELTPSRAIKFKLKLNDDLILTIIKPFIKPVDIGKDDLIYTLKYKKELLLSNATKIENIIEGAAKSTNISFP